MSDPQLYPAASASVAPRRHYLRYLILVALAGWALASYDVNLLVLALPDIARSLHISEAGLGVLGFSVYAAQFCITIWAGYAMDRFGRRRIWMFCLTGTALFTGLTYFVENFWQLVLVRADCFRPRLCGTWPFPSPSSMNRRRRNIADCSIRLFRAAGRWGCFWPRAPILSLADLDGVLFFCWACFRLWP